MILRPQTKGRDEFILWILCLTIAFMLGVPLIIQGVKDIESQPMISVEIKNQLPEASYFQPETPLRAPQQLLGHSHLNLDALAQANSIDESDNARWSLIRRTPVAAQVYNPESGLDWEGLRKVSQQGTILLPARFSWSFNETFRGGPGYKDASGILAGGHCALATVFRYAAVKSGLPTQARPHRWPIPGFSLEHTVNIYWGRDDLVVTNPFDQDLHLIWQASPSGIDVSVVTVNDINILAPLPDLQNTTIASVYGRPGGGWGSLGQTQTADQAIAMARSYAERVDQWNGDKKVIVTINPNVVMAGIPTRHDLYLQYLISEARRQGYYVMLDVQAGDHQPMQLFSRLMDKYLYENVWFDLDIEHITTGKITANRLNQLAEAYFTQREERGYQSPGVFAFYVFKDDQIINPHQVRLHYEGGVVVPIFDGHGGHGSDAIQEKITKTHRILALFEDGPYGIMEFETRWGEKYDRISAREYFEAFPDTLIMASQ